jgi:hypothetical protein
MYVFDGIGLALLATSTYLYYKGYIAPGSNEQRAGRSAASSRIQVAPEIFTERGGAGIVAQFEF